MNIGKISSKIIFSIARKSVFLLQGYRTLQKAYCALKVLISMNELLQVSHSIALSQLCDVGISMLGGG